MRVQTATENRASKERVGPRPVREAWRVNNRCRPNFNALARSKRAVHSSLGPHGPKACRPTSAFHALPLDCDHVHAGSCTSTHAVTCTLTCVGPQSRIDGHATATDAYRSRANGLPTPAEPGTKGIGSASERFSENDITDRPTEAGAAGLCGGIYTPR